MRPAEPDIFIVTDPDAVAAEVAQKWIERAERVTQNDLPFRVALSGGVTPRLLLEHLARRQNHSQIDWPLVHLFWGDERCVPPDDPDSNYGMAQEALLQHISIPEDNVHRIRGENDPQKESRRYAGEMRRAFGIESTEVPRFDWILLGLGVDGHTASLFPGQTDVLESQELCAVAAHPETGQQRITLTLPVLNRAACVSFLVTGLNKAGMLASVLHDPRRRERYPAAMVQAENTEWWVDREAAFHIIYSLE